MITDEGDKLTGNYEKTCRLKNRCWILLIKNKAEIAKAYKLTDRLSDKFSAYDRVSVYAVAIQLLNEHSKLPKPKLRVGFKDIINDLKTVARTAIDEDLYDISEEYARKIFYALGGLK